MRIAPLRQVGSRGGIQRDVIFATVRLECFLHFHFGRFGLLHQGVFLAIQDINLAVKGVSESVFRFGAGDVEEEIAEMAKKAFALGDADAVLPAGFPIFRASVHFGEELPASLRRVG